MILRKGSDVKDLSNPKSIERWKRFGWVPDVKDNQTEKNENSDKVVKKGRK